VARRAALAYSDRHESHPPFAARGIARRPGPEHRAARRSRRHQSELRRGQGGHLHTARPAHHGQRPEGHQRQNVEGAAASGNRQTLRGESIRSPQEAPPRIALRNLRGGHSGLRRKSHPQAGHHLLQRRRKGSQGGCADVPAVRREEAGSAAAERQLLRQLQRGGRPRREARRSLGPRRPKGGSAV